MYRQKTRRPAFKTAAQETAENRALDARLEQRDLERQEQLKSMFVEVRSQKSEEQIASEDAAWSRIAAKAADETRRQQECLDRRNAERLTLWTSGT
jgi:hypothetical protein